MFFELRLANGAKNGRDVKYSLVLVGAKNFEKRIKRKC